MPLIADISNIRAAAGYTGGNPASPQYWVKKLFGSTLTIAGVEINEDNALKYSAVWAAVSIISGAIGYLPLIAYKRDGRSRERLQSPIANLMHSRPNPYMSAIDFKETLHAHVLTWGNGYAEIERNNAGRAIGLWILPPNQVRVEVEKGKLIYVVNQNGGDEAKVAYENMLHIKGLGFDGLKGYSVIEYAAENLALGVASEKNAAAFFGNDSSPSGILTTDDPLTKETKEKVEKGWEEKHKGTDKRYKIAVLHSGLKWQQIGISAKDSQLIESRKFSINDVARWYSIPPHMLADLDRATFSNIEHQGIDFVKYTLGKWLEKWQQESTYKLLSTVEYDSGYYFEFLVDALLRGDSKTRAETYQIGLGGNNNPGYMTINEVRERENLPPVDGGDELFRPNYGSKEKEQNEFSALIDTAWQRIASKEIKAIRKSHKKPEQFAQWVDEFYDKHKDFAIAILKPIFEARQDGDAESVALVYVEERKAELKDAFELNNVESLLSEWEKLDLGARYEQTKLN